MIKDDILAFLDGKFAQIKDDKKSKKSKKKDKKKEKKKSGATKEDAVMDFAGGEEKSSLL